MTHRGLARDEGAAALLTTQGDLERLLALMAGWWAGRSLAQMAGEFGISRQRVAAILGHVGCTRRRWAKLDHERPDSSRRALAVRVAQAWDLLRHPLASRLTVRQRAAAAWQAQGLAQRDIAKRMGVDATERAEPAGRRWLAAETVGPAQGGRRR